jgi:hypothetical protein
MRSSPIWITGLFTVAFAGFLDAFFGAARFAALAAFFTAAFFFVLAFAFFAVLAMSSLPVFFHPRVAQFR